MKFITAFENIKKSLSEYKTENLPDVTIQVTLSNKDCGGTFYIEAKDNSLAVEPFDYQDNNAAIDIMYGDVAKLFSKKLSVDSLMDAGKLKVFGDTDALKALVLSFVSVEAPKKAVSVKKEEKKSCKKSL